jgi:hypothetical protein
LFEIPLGSSSTAPEHRELSEACIRDWLTARLGLESLRIKLSVILKEDVKSASKLINRVMTPQLFTAAVENDASFSIMATEFL